MTQDNIPTAKIGLFIIVTSAVTIVYLVLVANTPSWLIGTPEYQWPVLEHGLLQRLPWALIVMAIACAVSLFLVADVGQLIMERFGKVKVYASLLFIGIAFQLGPASVHRMGLIELPLRIYLPDHTSYFTDAKRIRDPGPWLKYFPEGVSELATHSRTHPPGAVLVFYAAQKVMKRLPGATATYVRLVPRSKEAMQKFGLSPPQAAAGGLCALILLLIAAGVVPLTFSLGRIITDDKRACMAAVFFAALPAFSHKTPVLDHALAAMILISLWLTLSAVRDKQLWRVGIAGLVIGIGLWAGTALLAALPLCILFAIAALYNFSRQDTPLVNHAILLLCIAVILCTTALAACALSGAILGVNYLSAYQAITEVGWHINNTASNRIHTWMWIAFNPYEVLAWAGVPVAAFFLLAVYRLVSKTIRREFDPRDSWLIALLAFLLALDLSGKVCYEASRLTWFIFPLIAIAAVRMMPLPGTGKKIVWPAIIIGLQAVSVLVFRMVF